MNNVMLVGRLVNEPTISINENGKTYSEIIVAVNRSFKNNEGIYETDFIPCIIYNEMANTTKEYCRKGDLLGIKGRLDSLWQNNRIVVVADKVTFLATKKTEEENELGKGEV